MGCELQVPRSQRSNWRRAGITSAIWQVVTCLTVAANRAIEDVQFGAGEAPLLIVARRGQGGCTRSHSPRHIVRRAWMSSTSRFG
jgi:uncharacterized membrane protein